MSLYGTLVRKVLFPFWEGRVRGRPTLERLAWLERMQWRPRAELETFQLAQLQKLIAHARANVPFYRDRLPERIDDLAELRKIPLLARSEARNAGDRRTSSAPPLPTVRKATSGTMGQPLEFGYE